MSTDSDFARIFLPWKSGTKARGFTVDWWIIARHLDETFHRQNIT